MKKAKKKTGRVSYDEMRKNTDLDNFSKQLECLWWVTIVEPPNSSIMFFSTTIPIAIQNHVYHTVYIYNLQLYDHTHKRGH